MTVTFFNNKSENNVLNKSLTQISVLTGTVKEPVGESVGEILIQGQVPAQANYCYISEFGRYYFISNPVHIRNDLTKISLACDVLMSFRDYILGLYTVVERSQYNGQQYLVDNMKPSYNFPMVLTKSFPHGFDGFNYYLAVAGGGKNEQV